MGLPPPTATKHVAALGGSHLGPMRYLCVARVGRDIVEEGRGKRQRGLEVIQHGLDKVGSLHARVGHHQTPVTPAKALGFCSLLGGDTPSPNSIRVGSWKLNVRMTARLF